MYKFNSICNYNNVMKYFKSIKINFVSTTHQVEILEWKIIEIADNLYSVISQTEVIESRQTAYTLYCSYLIG